MMFEDEVQTMTPEWESDTRPIPESDWGQPPGYDPRQSGAPSNAGPVSGDTWLDLVPGGRAAYNFIVSKVARFNLIGVEDVPQLESVLRQTAALADRDPVARRMHADAVVELGELSDSWRSIQSKLSALMAQLRNVGLGVVPAVPLVAIATTAVVVAGGMLLVFQSNENRQEQVSALVDRLVAAGLLSGPDAAKMLRGESWQDKAETVAKWALVLGAGLAAWSIYKKR